MKRLNAVVPSRHRKPKLADVVANRDVEDQLDAVAALLGLDKNIAMHRIN